MPPRRRTSGSMRRRRASGDLRRYTVLFMLLVDVPIDRILPRSTFQRADPLRCPHPAATPRRLCGFSAPRSIFRRWPNAAAVRRSIAANSAGFGLRGMRHQPDDGGEHLRRRHEGSRRNAQQQLRARRSIVSVLTIAHTQPSPAWRRSVRPLPAGTSASAARTHEPGATSRSATASQCCTADWPRPGAAPAPALRDPAPAHRRRPRAERPSVSAASSCIAATAR